MNDLKHLLKLCMALLLVSTIACKSDTEKNIEKTKDAIVEKTEDVVETTKEATEDAADSATEAARRVADSLVDAIEKIKLKLDPKTSRIMIEDSIVGRQTLDYRVAVKEGQQMRVTLDRSAGSPYFNVMEPGEKYVAIYNGSTKGNTYEGVAAESGEYTIRVYMMRSAARRDELAAYKLEVAVK